MPEIVPFKRDHCLEIVRRNGTVTEGVTPDEMIRAYTSPGSVAWTLLIDGMVIACGGIINIGWKRGEAWVLVGPEFYRYRLTGYKAIKKMLSEAGKGFRRVQSVVVDDGRIANHLGFSFEGKLRKYGPAGQDVFMYSMVTEGDQ